MRTHITYIILTHIHTDKHNLRNVHNVHTHTYIRTLQNTHTTDTFINMRHIHTRIPVIHPTDK